SGGGALRRHASAPAGGPARADAPALAALARGGPRAVARPGPAAGAMSAEVRRMFASIARRYDAANQVLSLGVHRGWRREAVRLSGARPGDRVLDCATGTGDLALSFKRAVGASGLVVGTDFCAEMLASAPGKARKAGLEVRFEVADALALPFAPGSFDIASIGFGIRN